MALQVASFVLAAAGHGGAPDDDDDDGSHFGGTPTYHYQGSGSGAFWVFFLIIGIIFVLFACSGVYYWQYPQHFHKRKTVTTLGVDGKPTAVVKTETFTDLQQVNTYARRQQISFDI